MVSFSILTYYFFQTLDFVNPTHTMSATIPVASSTATTIIASTSTDKPMTQEQHFQPSDFSFLAQLLGLLSRTEAGGIDNQELASMAGNLKNSFKKCQTILDHLPGADLSPDEQERVLAEELQILERKKWVETLFLIFADHYIILAKSSNRLCPL